MGINHNEILHAWRKRTGLASLVTILCGWLVIVVLTVLRFVNESWRYFLTERLNIALILVAVAATLSSLAFKGLARVPAVMAGVLFLLLALLVSLWLPGGTI